jgi:hypothetical protein
VSVAAEPAESLWSTVGYVVLRVYLVLCICLHEEKGGLMLQ